MKVSSLISTVLLALSLAGVAHAEPAKRNIAHATIEIAQCDVNGAAPCGISQVADKTGEVDLHALPPADPKQQPNADQASPVPEPQAFVMLMLGLVVLGVASRRGNPSEKFK